MLNAVAPPIDTAIVPGTTGGHHPERIDCRHTSRIVTPVPLPRLTGSAPL
jgi:hypothetical protein